MSNPSNKGNDSSKRINLLEVKGGNLIIRHFNGKKTDAQVQVSRRTVRIGCFAMSKKALRAILPELQNAAMAEG